MRFRVFMIASQTVLIGKKSPKHTQFCQIPSGMKISNKPPPPQKKKRNEILIKHYLRSIVDISVDLSTDFSWNLAKKMI